MAGPAVVSETRFPPAFADPEEWESPQTEESSSSVSSSRFSKKFFSLFSLDFEREFASDPLDHPLLNKLYETLRPRDNEAWSRKFLLNIYAKDMDLGRRYSFGHRFCDDNPFFDGFAHEMAEEPLWTMFSVCLHLTPWSLIGCEPYDIILLMREAPDGLFDSPAHWDLKQSRGILFKLTKRIIYAIANMESQVLGMSMLPLTPNDPHKTMYPSKADLKRDWRRSARGHAEAEYLWRRLDKIYVILQHWRTMDHFCERTCREFFNAEDDDDYNPWDCPGMVDHVRSIFAAMFDPDLVPGLPHTFHPRRKGSGGDVYQSEDDSSDDSDDDDDDSSLFGDWKSNSEDTDLTGESELEWDDLDNW